MGNLTSINILTKQEQDNFVQINRDFFQIIPTVFLGKGSYGKVYKGYWKSMNKIIAIKQIDLSKNKQNSFLVKKQIQVMKQLSSLSHQNIVHFYGFQQKKNDFFLFLEYCPHGELREYINKGISQISALKLFRQMLEGMCYINAKGKMHRDLKPENILITEDYNKLKISDFGFGIECDNVNLTGPRGTLYYVAPEVYNQINYIISKKNDVWSGGLILYELLTSKKKKKLFKIDFKFNIINQLKKQWKQLQRGAKKIKYYDLHPYWQYFTNIMLTYDPQHRPTYAQILQKLKKVYNTMQAQISNEQVVVNANNIKLMTLQKYLRFQIQKYEILITTCKLDLFLNFESADKNILNYTIIFLLVGINLSHSSIFQSDLKYRLIKLPGDNDYLIDQKKLKQDQKVLSFCMDQYQNKLYQKYIFKAYQIKKIVGIHIKQYYSLINHSQISFQTKQILQLVKAAFTNQFFNQHNYSKHLKRILIEHFFTREQNFQSWQHYRLKSLLLTIICTSLNTVFTTDNYKVDNFIQQRLQKLCQGTKENLINNIREYKKILFVP